jgi:branched-chain amino acid transport system ATP-binding protein
MPGGRGVFPGLTVRENLLLANWLTKDPREVDERMAEVYEIFPVLATRASATATSLSGGEQQMLSLARAIVVKPRLLMVDELSLGLAPRVVKELFGTLETIRDSGTTILLVEQYVRYALRLADIVVIMHKGRVAFIGEPGELAHEGKLVEAYLGGTQAAQVEEVEIPAPTTASATSGARPKRKIPDPRAKTRPKYRA